MLLDRILDAFDGRKERLVLFCETRELSGDLMRDQYRVFRASLIRRLHCLLYGINYFLEFKWRYPSVAFFYLRDDLAISFRLFRFFFFYGNFDRNGTSASDGGGFGRHGEVVSNNRRGRDVKTILLPPLPGVLWTSQKKTPAQFGKGNVRLVPTSHPR